VFQVAARGIKKKKEEEKGRGWGEEEEGADVKFNRTRAVSR
jgi:hypothetical protein